MPNFQYIPYTLVAVGLINAVYRNSDSSALTSSYLLIAFGLLLFVASRVNAMKGLLEKSAARWTVLAISAALILLTVFN